jgi:hypothetical protein
MNVATPLISSPKLTFAGTLRGIAAIASGAILAVIGILFHNSYSPVGLIIALLISGTGFFFFARKYSGRILHLLIFFSWLSVVYKSATFGVSQEILVEGNANGFTFFLGGMIVNFLALIFAKRFK